jgi:hypothetical protein
VDIPSRYPSRSIGVSQDKKQGASGYTAGGVKADGLGSDPTTLITYRERANADVADHRGSVDIYVAREPNHGSAESDSAARCHLDVNADGGAGDARAIAGSTLSEGQRPDLCAAYE